LIKSILLQNFRSHALFNYRDLPNLVFILGENGVGKTSILEAISFLSPGKGIRSATLDQCLKFNNTQLAVRIDMQDYSLSYELNMHSARRRNFIDEKPIKNVAQNLSFLNVIWISPKLDNVLASAKSEKRKWFDRLVYQIYSVHAANIIEYEKLLTQRIKILKTHNPDEAWLDRIELYIAKFAYRVMRARADTMEMINNNLSESPSFLHWPCLYITIDWKSFNEERELSEEGFVRQYIAALKNARNLDKITGRSNFGCHKVDFIINDISRNTNSNFFSTGQLKSALLQITLSHLGNCVNKNEAYPILLLDDLFSHFDNSIIVMILDYLSQLERVQTFITTTTQNKECIEANIKCKNYVKILL
jgi:DNA replication and repair protein RecF